MDAFTYAIRRVQNSDIPDELLNDAFIDRDSRIRRNSRSVFEAIRDEIIIKRVMPDLSKIGGVQVDVSLQGIPQVSLPDNVRIFTIPLEKTMNRLITNPLGIYLNVTSNFADRHPGQTFSPFYMAPIERSVKRVINSYRPIPYINNVRIEIESDNVIRVRDYQNFSPDSTLRCLVEYSETFSELKPAYYTDFANLVSLATKAYIFRKLAISVDRAKLDGGRELGRYREFLDQYSEMFNSYEQLLNEKWAKVLLLNDQQRNEAHVMRAGHIRT